MAKPENLKSKTQPRIQRYFSEGFRRQKVEEIEKNISKVSEICREYQVSTTSVYKWIYKYSVMRKKAIKQVVEAQSDTRKIIHLKEQVKQLERIIGQKQILIDIQEKVIEIAEQEYNIDIKKKFASMPYAGSGKTETNTTTK